MGGVSPMVIHTSTCLIWLSTAHYQPQFWNITQIIHGALRLSWCHMTAEPDWQKWSGEYPTPLTGFLVVPAISVHINLMTLLDLFFPMEHNGGWNTNNQGADAGRQNLQVQSSMWLE
jgi:hypothetical protein